MKYFDLVNASAYYLVHRFSGVRIQSYNRIHRYIYTFIWLSVFIPAFLALYFITDGLSINVFIIVLLVVCIFLVQYLVILPVMYLLVGVFFKNAL